MGILEWATSPWGKAVPVHIAWFLVWVAVLAGLLFVIGHAIYIALLARPKEFASSDSPTTAARIPERVPRHSLTARLFHWVMAIAMFALLLTAFLPKVGVRFEWVTYHWIAGVLLTASIIFHVIHASFFLDFWSIWPDAVDLRDALRRTRRFIGEAAPPPDRFAKYPLENKLYHLSIMAAGLSVIVTGVFMMQRVRTTFFVRNPYALSDLSWGMTYVLHGLAGVGLITLVMMHVYFGLRPEKRAITKSMIFGWMSRDFYLKEHDPRRWPVEVSPSTPKPSGS